MNRKYNPWVSLVALLLAAIILVLTCTGCHSVAAAENETEPAPRFAYEAAGASLDFGLLYIITDTETGVQYLAWWHRNGAAMTELLPGEGKE